MRLWRNPLLCWFVCKQINLLYNFTGKQKSWYVNIYFAYNSALLFTSLWLCWRLNNKPLLRPFNTFQRVHHAVNWTRFSELLWESEWEKCQQWKSPMQYSVCTPRRGFFNTTGFFLRKSGYSAVWISWRIWSMSQDMISSKGLSCYDIILTSPKKSKAICGEVSKKLNPPHFD